MSAAVPLDDLPRDLDALYSLHDELGEQIERLCDQRAEVSLRIWDIQNGADEWTSYKDCTTGERRIG